MGFAIPSFNNANLLNSATESINDFTRRNPLASIVAAVALSILAFNALAAGGLLSGSIFTFGAFTIAKHMFSHREEFLELIRLSFLSLKTISFDHRQAIEKQAQYIRDKIAARADFMS